MKIYVGCASDKGAYKTKNQDRAVCRIKRDRQSVLAVACVCDGISSFINSEISSEIITEGITRWFDGISDLYPGAITKDEMVNDLEVTIRELNEIVCMYRKKEDIDIGCTMSILILIDESYYVFHVGDGRIYCMDTTLCQITHDEVSVTELDGRVKSRLANYIGKNEVLWVNKFSGDVKEGDMFILGSDGLFKRLGYDDLYNVKKKIKSDRRAMNSCCDLIELVIGRGEQDNISCILLYISSLKKH